MTIEIPIISTYKDKGAKQAKSSLDKLSGTAKKLGLALGLALSVNKIVAFGKSSVAEFTASEKAAASLQNTLKNTGNLMAFPDAEAGIKNLGKLSGIADDSLIPLFSQLYLATGNVNTAMKDLNTAIDVSRGSSNDLGTVVDALSKGYAGNTKALGNLNVGLNKAYLASNNMVGIQKQLNETFSGASAAYLDTYAGKIGVLNNQWNESKEIIGQGLVMAFETAAGSRGIGGATAAMETFAYTIDAVIIKLAQLTTADASGLNVLDRLGLSGLNLILRKTTEGWNYLLGVDETRLLIQNEIWKANTKTFEMAQKNADDQAKRNKDYLAFLAKQKALSEASAKAAAKRAAEEKKIAAERKMLEQAGSIFNLEEIQIYAALQNKVTENEKLRLSLQLALVQENASEASRLATSLAISQLQTTNLAEAIRKLPPALNPFTGWSSELDLILLKLGILNQRLQNQSVSGNVRVPLTPTSAASVLANAPQATSEYQSITGVMGELGIKTPSINITVNNAGNVVSDADLVNQIRNGLLNSNLSGSPSSIGRLLGAFQ
jgi:hypothetical protein